MATAHDELGLNYTDGTVLGSVQAPDWGVVPGRPAPTIKYFGNSAPDGVWGDNCMQACCVTRDNATPTRSMEAVYWKAATFGPNQYAEIAHNPLSNGGKIPNVGAVCRQDPSSDTCYVAYALYVVDPGGVANFEGYYPGDFAVLVNRVNNGVVTQLALIEHVPLWVYADDWWYLQFQVLGTNPVRLRVITKAPTDYVLGSAPWNGTTNRYQPSQCEYPGGITNTYKGPGVTLHDLQVPAADGGEVLYTETDALNPSRSWLIWEGVDDSASRIVSGQPGFRWGAPSAAEASFVYGWFDAAKFRASDELAAPLDIVSTDPVASASTTVHGTFRLGTTVSLTAPGATVGAVSYPTDTTWECVVSDLPAGVTTITATSSTGETASVEVTRPVQRSAGAWPVYAGRERRSSAATLRAQMLLRATALYGGVESDPVTEIVTLEGYAAKAQRSGRVIPNASATMLRSETAQPNVVALAERSETVQPQASTSGRRSGKTNAQAASIARRSGTARGQATSTDRRPGTTRPNALEAERRAARAEAQGVKAARRSGMAPASQLVVAEERRSGSTQLADVLLLSAQAYYPGGQALSEAVTETVYLYGTGTGSVRRSAGATSQGATSARRSSRAQGQGGSRAERSATVTPIGIAASRRSGKAIANAAGKALRSASTSPAAEASRRRSEGVLPAIPGVRRSETSTPQRTATARRSSRTSPDASGTALRSSTAATQQAGAGRRSSIASPLDAIARRSETAEAAQPPSTTGADRRSGSTQPEGTASERRTATAVASMTRSQRRASAANAKLPGEAVRSTLRSGTTLPQPVTGRRSGKATPKGVGGALRSSSAAPEPRTTWRRSAQARAAVPPSTAVEAKVALVTHLCRPLLVARAYHPRVDAHLHRPLLRTRILHEED